MKLLRVFLVGIYFGIVLVKSEVASWFRIQSMFQFKEAHMYLIIASAIVVGMLSVFIIPRFQVRTVDHEPIVYQPKPFTKGTLIGGVLFGMGWAITGACPGPIYAQLRAGEWLAGVTFLSALAGMYLYAYFQPRLPH